MRAEQLIELRMAHGFTFFGAIGTILRGWARVRQGVGEDGIVEMQQGLAAHQATGAVVNRTYYLALLAEAYGALGQAEKGLAVLAEAMTLVTHTGERWWQAELTRLQGELRLQQAEDHQMVEAEQCLRQALEQARSQQAKSLELRAATSLARLWQSQGKCQEVHDLLASVYGWFTEGIDTAALIEAKGLLAALA
jgi:predicted ATPase